MHRAIVRTLWSAVAAAALATAPVGARSDVNSSIFLTVAKDDKPVTGLAARNFQVMAGGQLRQVVSAEPASEPLSLILFVQTLRDDTPLMRSAIRGVLEMVRTANPQARVALVTTAAAPEFLSVTSQAGLLERTIGTFFTDDNIGSIIERLPGLTHALEAEPNRRRVILSITPPGVTHGVQLSADTAPSLQRCGCGLWGLVLAPAGAPLLDQDDVFSNLIAVSGGRRATVFGAPLLEGGVRVMMSLLLGQYKVTFERPDSNQPLNLRVGVNSDLTGLKIYAPGWTIP